MLYQLLWRFVSLNKICPFLSCKSFIPIILYHGTSWWLIIPLYKFWWQFV